MEKALFLPQKQVETASVAFQFSTMHRLFLSGFLRFSFFIPLIWVVGLAAWPAAAVTVNSADQHLACAWLDRHLAGEPPKDLPFSFIYDGKSSRELLPNWKFSRAEKKLECGKTETTLTFAERSPGLEVRVVIVRDELYPAGEWTVFFRNQGSKPTAILEKILAMDAVWDAGGTPVSLRYANGSNTTPDSYRPWSVLLPPERAYRMTSKWGRPSYGSSLPFGCLETEKGGMFYAIGWPGQWTMSVESAKDGQTQLQIGQALTHFHLLPGEQARSPLMAVLFYQGNSARGVNLWRKWMVERNLPRTDGKPPQPMLVACSSHQFNEMLGANEENQKLFIDRFLEEKLPLKYWWMDAGWYVNNGEWINVGTWEVDRKRFPSGLRAITDHGRAKGVKSIVWFEPERVTANSWLYDKKPNWLLSPANLPQPLEYQKPWRLLNLGNEEARKWVTDRVSDLITSEGIDLYRQDFNMDPYYFWTNREAEDRQGITENLYVQGYLKFWDDLVRRHPDLQIDSCASGGRRNDLETLRRALPLLRDDHLFEPAGQQGHTYGISYWIPYHGTGTMAGPSKIFKDQPNVPVDDYFFRSHMAPSLNICMDMRERTLNYEKLRRLTGQFERIAPFYLADYYPLTPYSLDPKLWMAWQFDRPETGEGIVQAFRRKEAPEASANFKLQGLDAKATYEVENLDGGKISRSGKKLMQEGLMLESKESPASFLFAYKKKS